MRFLSVKTPKVSVASLILAGSYLISALLGMIRDRFLAGRFGAGDELDAYYAAFTVPDLISLLLIFGAISAAVIPIFSFYVNKSKKEAWEYVSVLLNIFLIIVIAVCLILIVFAPFFINLIVPGFSVEKKEITVLLMRIMFLSPVLLGISSIISGILQVFHRFLATALAPIMYNLGIVVGILFLVPIFGLKGLAFGVVLGALLHLGVQLPALFHSGFQYEKIFNFYHPGIKKTLKLMIPRSLGLGAGQFNTIVITAIASTLTAGSVAIYNLANNLSAMMVNSVAVSLSTALFPGLSMAYSQEDKFAFNKKFSAAFHQILFLIIPISVILFFLRAQIVRVVLGTGKFAWIDTRLTAACLGIFSLGLVAQGLIFLLSKTFYAVHNTKIPAIISAATVILNILLSVTFIKLLIAENYFAFLIRKFLKLDGILDISVLGLVLALTITAAIEALVLLFLAHRKLQLFQARQTLLSLVKIIFCALIMIFSIVAAKQLVVDLRLADLRTFVGVLLQLIISGLFGLLIYLIFASIINLPEFNTIKKYFFKNDSR